MAKLENAGSITQKIFQWAYDTKLKRLGTGVSSPLLDKLVFNKFKDQVGGRLRYIVSGGAPISVETHQFLRVCFGIPVCQGYGLTETCGVMTLMAVDDFGNDETGATVPSCEVKLVDVPDMGYNSKDKPNPRGEVAIRGPNVTMGYYNNEKKTKEDFRDGWFFTGDIGRFNSDGTLSIIDRKKNLVKLSHGEYIALEKLESKFKVSKYCENICVYADGFRDYPVALVVPAKTILEDWATKNNIHEPTFEALCSRREAKKLILDSILEIGKKEALKSIELPQKVFLCSFEWTPENECLTAAFKVKRQTIIAKLRSEIDALYAN